MKQGELKNSSKRETVGKIATDLAKKDTVPYSPIDLMGELLTDYEKNLWECVERHIRDYDLKNFYVVVITKKEPLMQNVLRNYFMARISCPTPDYDQTVYKYTRENDQIEFLWVIPSRDSCMLLRENASKVSPEEYGLLDFVIKFADGTLFELAKKLNGEKTLDSPLLDK